MPPRSWCVAGQAVTRTARRREPTTTVEPTATAPRPSAARPTRSEPVIGSADAAAAAAGSWRRVSPSTRTSVGGLCGRGAAGMRLRRGHAGRRRSTGQRPWHPLRQASSMPVLVVIGRTSVSLRWFPGESIAQRGRMHQWECPIFTIRGDTRAPSGRDPPGIGELRQIRAPTRYPFDLTLCRVMTTQGRRGRECEQRNRRGHLMRRPRLGPTHEGKPDMSQALTARATSSRSRATGLDSRAVRDRCRGPGAVAAHARTAAARDQPSCVAGLPCADRQPSRLPPSALAQLGARVPPPGRRHRRIGGTHRRRRDRVPLTQRPCCARSSLPSSPLRRRVAVFTGS